jgi:hypothetical protein
VELDVIGSGSCKIRGIHINGAEASGYATRGCKIIILFVSWLISLLLELLAGYLVVTYLVSYLENK